jgi:hypothetical protein
LKRRRIESTRTRQRNKTVHETGQDQKPYNLTGIGPGDVSTEANKYGQQGWELATGGGDNGSIWCFKRPLGAGAPVPVSAQ